MDNSDPVYVDVDAATIRFFYELGKYRAIGFLANKTQFSWKLFDLVFIPHEEMEMLQLFCSKNVQFVSQKPFFLQDI